MKFGNRIHSIFGSVMPTAWEQGWHCADQGDDQAAGGGAAGGGDEAALGDAGKAALAAEREALKAARRELHEAKAKLQAVEGIDANVFREATEKARELEARNQELLTAAERARQETEQVYSVKLQEKSKRVSDLETKLFEREMEYQGERMFLKAKGRTEVSENGASNFGIFWREVRHHFGRDDQGIYVIDRSAGDSKTPLIDAESGKRVDPAKYVAEVLAEDRVLSHLFEPKFGTGGNATGNRDRRTIQGVDLDGMNPTQLIAAGLKG